MNLGSVYVETGFMLFLAVFLYWMIDYIDRKGIGANEKREKK